MKKYMNTCFFIGIIFLFLAILWFTRMNSPVCGALYALCSVINFINAVRMGKAEQSDGEATDREEESKDLRRKL